MYIYILRYVCCVSFIVINMTIFTSCKKIYGKINDMNMNEVNTSTNFALCNLCKSAVRLGALFKMFILFHIEQ